MAKRKVARKRRLVKKPKTKSNGKSNGSVKLSTADKKTMKSLKDLANGVVQVTQRSRAPHLDIPSRSLSNVKFNRSRKIIEMGKNKNRRELFNLSQAKSYMQTMLVSSGCKQLIEQGKTTSIRGMYYLLKHTIEGTKEETFDDQGDCDPIIEDLEVTLDALREELHLYASNRGNMFGDVTLVDLEMNSNKEINCREDVGRNGYSIPSIVEPNSIKLVKHNVKFILHVEKDTVFNRFVQDRFFDKHKCLLTHGSGQPPRGVRRMLNRLHNEFKLPIYCLLDNDPWGYYIYSVIKQGSINLAFESKRMAIPDAKFMGLRSLDFERCDLNPSVQIKLSDSDKKRTKQIASYPWFEKKREWQKEFKKMLDNDFKLEVEALISKDISYVTEEYVPQRLKDKDFLD